MLTVDQRWEQGIEHHPRSEAIGAALRRINADNAWPMDLEFGGDGDNGETLLYLLDIYFEQGGHEERKLKCTRCGNEYEPGSEPYWCPAMPGGQWSPGCKLVTITKDS